MLPKSHTLFHFTKNIEFLKDILVNGFWPRYCIEDTGWYGGYRIAYPMVCFCDIPLSRVSDHVDFYGNYGIGVTREWAQSNGLSPVMYINQNTPVHSSLSMLLSGNRAGNGYYPLSNSDVNILMANIKPLQGQGKIMNVFCAMRG
ncbi:abortive infection system antitoxin AbiGi family protein [bacterium 19MO03SA05]|uniref:Abortive infection system antitoxin AbiGi family protein n=1 Tax=bacterium 19MO03SA05 TaxID=2920620 RepID=A0AAU6VJS1_UNCXX|nr:MULTISPECIES: abortive infection system antitoxin AbiGi family protein [unclassified Vibrio]